MELIRQNPYHVVGILAGANQRTIAKQRAKINAFQKVGKSIEFDNDLEFIGIPERTNGDLEKAFSKIEINQSKLFNALFWFANHNHLDETALTYLQSCDIAKAEDIWQKVINGKEVSSKNFTAFNNLGTLKLASAFKTATLKVENLEEGIRLKTKLLTSDHFSEFGYLVADETYIVDADKELETFTNALLEEVIKSKSIEAMSVPAIFSGVHPKVKSFVLEKLTDEPLHHIERKTQQTKNARNERPEEGLQLARNLYRDTKSDLTTLSALLGKTELKYKMVADRLAKEFLQCGIDYFKEYQEDEKLHDGDLGNDIIRLFRVAESIAVGAQVKERIEDNVNGLQEWKKNRIIKPDLDAIIALLEDDGVGDDLLSQLTGGSAGLDSLLGRNTIEKAESLVTKAIPHLINLKAVLKYDNEVYLSLSTSIVAKAQNIVIETVNSAQKRTGLFGEVDISGLKSKIKKAWKVTQIIGSIDMANDFQDNYLNNKNTLKDICSQLDISTQGYNYGKIPQLNFIITGSEIINTDNKPLYDKYIRYVGLNLYVIALDTQEIEFFLKYINPKGKYSSNSKLSPDGYTLSSLKKITPTTKRIEFSSWGDSKKCTYQIGTHKIEVWVDNFMIFEKDFSVELSPSQKIEREIKKAENKINQINQTTYYESEITTAKREMSEIKKFKLFRSRSKKEEQIEYQQQKIDNIMIKENQKKSRLIRSQEQKINQLEKELSAEKY